MIVWSEILESIPPSVDVACTIAEALALFQTIPHKLAMVQQEKRIVGYIDVSSILEQLRSSLDIQQVIRYDQDMLMVPEQSPVEFYHNISVVLGVNEKGEITGFIRMEEARSKLNETKLEQMNRILNGAGIGIVTTDSHFHISFVNEMGEKILGVDRSFLMNRNYKILLETNRDLGEVLKGKQLFNVASSFNFKQIIGNCSPFVVQGQISGMVHIFGQREQWEEGVSELEFVRHLSEDLQAIYSSSREQILVVDGTGKIIRIAGTFLKEYWMTEDPQDLIGRDVKELEKEGRFGPNVVELCKRKQGKVSSIQETVEGRKVWSVANPVFHGDKLEKVVIISHDMTEMDRLRQKLEIAQQQSESYKHELEDLMERTGQRKTLLYRSQIMEDTVDEMRRIASVDSTVMLFGESGVGKEVFAHAIHESSKRKDQPFIRVNCGAIPENLIESELFGYEKGAFTGADLKGKPGFFELAHKGTLFLDEITELPLNMQVKLLRVLQEREIVRVGGIRTIPIDVRIISATNRDIRERVEEGQFREDLYYRLNVIPISIPPLRDRPGDIASLAMHFLQKFNHTYEKEKSLSREALEILENYHWPGNVRELQNVMERIIVTTRHDYIEGHDILPILYADRSSKKIKPMVFDLMPMKDAIAELESQLIQLALRKHGSAAKASQILGISPATISRRMNKSR
ncbi:sigma 54-interacting transcriptional regulator [Ammoniphilus sp. YIM 78166]|uniref:sigma 54-interacting transcriptional regulator n=1 Tax=Ammoniphilus sp. YIM 78166 TaxID=1644106 RepID=UPI001F0F2FD7|nr:sigma 54-interacting transcriptional regulator [Ammoniphilus sp. YIM 78166]